MEQVSQKVDLKMAPSKKEENLIQSEDHVSPITEDHGNISPVEDEESLRDERKRFNKETAEKGESQVNQPNEPEMIRAVGQVCQQVNLELVPSNEEEKQLTQSEEHVNVEISPEKKWIPDERKSIDEATASIIEVSKAERTPSVSSNEASHSISQLSKNRSCCHYFYSGLWKLSSCCIRTLNYCFFWVTYLFIICLLIFILFRLN